MKSLRIRKLAIAAAAASATLLSSGAALAYTNSLTFQGVTFETLAAGNNLTLTISNALTGGTGNWLNVSYLNAIELKGVGDVTSASITGEGIVGSFAMNVANGVASAAGCTTGGTPGACFDFAPAIALDDLMTYTIAFVGSNLDFSAPHLKVQFFEQLNQTKATGDLLSQTIPAIPEPSTYALMLAGLGLVGFMARRRRSAT